jgi:hypothetical protein
MAFTPKQILKHLAGTLKTTPELLVYCYQNSSEIRTQLDEYADELNIRRIKNGLEPLIFSEKLLVVSE